MTRCLISTFRRDQCVTPKCEILVVSHCIGGNPEMVDPQKNSLDNYFGTIMHQADDKKISISFLMHEKAAVQSKINQIVYKTLPYFIKASIQVFKDFKSSKYNGNKVSVYKAIRLFHFHDVLDWMIAFSILEHAKKSDCDKVLITFEGNIWENNLIGILRSFDIIAIGYLHGPLRVGFVEKIKQSKFALPDLVLLKSKHELKIFDNTFPSVSKEVVGSHRFSEKTSANRPQRIEVQAAQFIFTPEGLKCEVDEHLKFAIALKKYPTADIVFRFHPNFKSEQDEGTLLEHGVLISNGPLEEDLNRSTYCVYRGSTVCFQALNNGCIPLYLKLNDDMNISPLKFLLKENLPEVSPKYFTEDIAHYAGENFLEQIEYLKNKIGTYPEPSDWKRFFQKVNSCDY